MTNYSKNEPATIKAMFNSIAKRYDRTNAILSFNFHKRWNRCLVEEALQKKAPKVFLDLCAGTGAIALEYLEKSQDKKTAYLLDFSSEMLAHAKEAAKTKNFSGHEIIYLQADAENIPLTENCVGCATMAYGMRNIKHPERSIQEAFRVLAPGGTFGILELTQPKNPLLRFGHTLYLRTVLPLLGKLATSNKEAYNYLCNSIHNFIPPEALEKLLVEANFTSIVRRSLFGGIATLITAKKP
jgi:demethylmenaquinone methyltransferase/2-methoxy-6-polyprenyl-1,4-benzoquinol methylase